MSNGLDRKARLFAVPDWALNFAARLLGKTEMMEKLTGDLRIDMSVTQRVLDWKPPVTVAEGFRMMNPDE
jgi:UDP-glucose 4-epimerase